MAALAADINIETLGDVVIGTFSANGADTFYQGALVYIDAGGGVQVVPAGTDRFLGISIKKQVIAAATDEVEVLIDGYVWVPVGTGIAAEDEGDPLIMDITAATTDNVADCVSAQPEGDTVLGADDIYIGRILRVTATQMLISIGHKGLTGDIVAATVTNAHG